MTTLPTLIAELEEALKAATPGPWGTAGRTMVCSLNDAPYPELLADASQCINDEANARLIALMRNSLPTLIEAVKRQGEALEEIIKLDDPYANWSEEMANIARAALTAHKEATDV